MKILHTSDWHLGRTLHGRRCHTEFQQFLDWLSDTIYEHEIDYLLISGDIFDSFYPSNTTQKLYYSFLYTISKSCCRHVIIIGGNHDSPALLHAPSQLLRQLNITVVGSVTGDPEDQVVVLNDRNDKQELIVCAVPFLRDKDIRYSDAGESYEEKVDKLSKGIEDHYHRIAQIAREKKDGDHKVPLIGMGHLFTTGGKVAENTEVRDLYVGSLAHFHPSRFPKEFDYLALGHLHLPQYVGKEKTIRYCGSPLQLSFGKGNDQKSITLLTFSNSLSISEIPVPPFLPLTSISGSMDDIETAVQTLLSQKKPYLVEIIATIFMPTTFIEEMHNLTAQSQIEIIRIMQQRTLQVGASTSESLEKLDELEVIDVFRRCLTTNNIDEEEKKELLICFEEVLTEVLLTEREEG